MIQALPTILLHALAPAAPAIGDEPPPGPPWHLTYDAARLDALAHGRPIFVYFSKTWCPHCVPVEQELLSNPKLEPHYSKVTWLFTSRSFKDDARDRQARRTHDRFGVTSWPGLLLIDPRDERALADMPRTLEPWLRRLEPWLGAVPAATGADRTALQSWAKVAARRRVGSHAAADELAMTLAAGNDGVGVHLAARALLRSRHGDRRTLQERLADPDVTERALALEALADDASASPDDWQVAVTRLLLDDQESIVVRLRALAWATTAIPATVAAHAERLLAVANDAFRNQVLALVATMQNPALAPLLSRMFADAGAGVPSRNPNVLRLHIANCLGGSGDASVIPAVTPLVRGADPRNATTKAVVRGLGMLARRLPPTDRGRIVELLLDGLPAALSASPSAPELQLCLALAAELDQALAAASGTAVVPPPQSWRQQDRDAHLETLRRTHGAGLRR